MIFKHKNPEVTQLTVRGIEINFVNSLCETENSDIIEILKNSKDVTIEKKSKITTA